MSGKKNNIFPQLCKHRSLGGESGGEDVTPDGELPGVADEVLSTPVRVKHFLVGQGHKSCNGREGFFFPATHRRL